MWPCTWVPCFPRRGLWRERDPRRTEGVAEPEKDLARAEEALCDAASEVLASEAPRVLGMARRVLTDLQRYRAELRFIAEHLAAVRRARCLALVRETFARDGWFGNNVPADGDESLLREVESFVNSTRLPGDNDDWRSHPALVQLREWHEALLRNPGAQLE